jgi:hypothetical protein
MLIRTKYKAPKLQGIDDKIIATGIDALCEDITDDGDGIYELTQEGEIVKGLIEQLLEEAESNAKQYQRSKDIRAITELLDISKDTTEPYKWGVLDALFQLREKEED